MEQRLSLVTLGVANVGRSRRFYESLGWRASSVGGEEAAFFQLGGIALGLYGRASLAADAGLPADGRILKPAEEVFWGGYSGYFADPDGHPWEVAWNPGFQIAADGSIQLPD
jgi:catechol 2,3-dioxygenase-like lactoylglutathione lyase family enzyme